MKNNTFKIPVSILLSSMACFAIGLYGALPWWSFMVTNFIVAIAIPQKPWVAFLTGALGVGAIWAGLATGMDMANNHLLSSKVATILPLNGSYVLLIVITGLVGFLLGGMSSLTASYLRKA
ncbi:MAG: hypothetical protein RLZZ328_779 [Bacteroidota bacterium]|jgi:hypothetical protein|nr:hypothetical protein [Sediminibacterium sp.]